MRNNKIYLYLGLFVFLILHNVGVAAMDVNIFIDEVPGKYTIPRNFRSNSEEYIKKINNGINKHGLYDLHASASAQFSEQTLKAALPLMLAKNIFIIDLRLESHGFVNGIPISWYGLYNQTNLGKTPQEIKSIEQNLLEELHKEKAVTIYHGNKLEPGIIQRGEAVPIALKLAETEEQLTKRLGLGYKRFYVLDHAKPDNHQIDEFVQFVKKLPKDSWLHFHCRGGRGRSTTFIAMYDMLKNATEVSFDDIMSRQIDLGGSKILISSVDEKADLHWKDELARHRHNFIRLFYEYAKDPKGYAERGWEEWLDLTNRK